LLAAPKKEDGLLHAMPNKEDSLHGYMPEILGIPFYFMIII
jgi:hypothetical protein